MRSGNPLRVIHVKGASRPSFVREQGDHLVTKLKSQQAEFSAPSASPPSGVDAATVSVAFVIQSRSRS